MDYKKPSLTWPEHITLLEQQGLLFTSSIAPYCSLVSFHRLSPYLGVYYKAEEQHFLHGTTFEHVWRLYEFDRKLRLLVSDAVERIEVAFRTVMSETMSKEHGGYWFLEKSLFKSQSIYQRFMTKLAQACQDKHDEELKHYYSRYHSPDFPPSWIVFEKLSFGTCTNLFRNIKSIKYRKIISDEFGCHPTLMASWIDALRYTRNLCAHHSRLWNRWFVTIPILPARFQAYKKVERNFITQAIIIDTLLHHLLPQNDWHERLQTLFEQYTDIPFTHMGFQQDWQNSPFWDSVKNR